MKPMTYVCIGLLAGLAAVYILSVFQAAGPAWVAHALAVGGILLSATALLRTRRAEPGGGTQALCALIAGFAIAISLGLAASVASLSAVADRAREVARDAPFCIQVADNARSSYKPAGALLDLSGLTLWSLSRAGHHAILVVGEEPNLRYFHWSYRGRDFVPGAISGSSVTPEPAVTCIPRREFVAGLPMLFPATSATRYVRFSPQEAFRIPDAYQPRWSGSRALWLAVAAPEFAPLGRSWDGLSAFERDSKSVVVEFDIRAGCRA